ncbi:MAG: HAMP domain-containing sensor histidine kinase [Candidatus Zixiibacteriota bacterium]
MIANKKHIPGTFLVYLYGIILVIVIIGIHVMPGKSQTIIELPNIDDNEILPYKFVVRQMVGGGSKKHKLIPVDIDGDSVFESIEFQYDFLAAVSKTSIVCFKDIMTKMAHTQIIFDCDNLYEFKIADVNNDGLKDMILPYRYRDSMWLNIVSFDDSDIFRGSIIECDDKNHDGEWDGASRIMGQYDVNLDGYPEIFVYVGAGYDRSPRKVLCFDWRHASLLWDCDIPGIASDTILVREPDSIYAAPRFLFSSYSNCNGVHVPGTELDDCHSYIICVDTDGRILWSRQCGEKFSGGGAVLSKYKDKPVPLIYNQYTYTEFASENAAINKECGGLRVYDWDGNLVDSMDLGIGSRTKSMVGADIDSDGNDEVCLTLDNNRLVCFDNNFTIVRDIRYSCNIFLRHCADFLNRGYNQLFVETSDYGYWLLDKDFTPLAKFACSGESIVFKDSRFSEYLMVMSNSDMIRMLGFQRTPWYTVFSRHPIYAFFVAAVPLSIIILIVWSVMRKFRKKNTIIEQQKTELEEAQEKLIAQEKYLQAKDIAGGFAHEIRNALFPARTSLSLLKKTCAADSAAAQQATMINRSVARAIKITSLISQYTKLESDIRPEICNVKTVLQSVLAENEYRIDTVAPSPDISCDISVEVPIHRDHLYMVFSNLILNSLDAIEESGKAGKLALHCSDADGTVMITVEDNGVGIPEHMQSRIFDTFVSTKPGTGTGLGLSIVKKIVEMYNGAIHVTSTPGEGTLFSINLRT